MVKRKVNRLLTTKESHERDDHTDQKRNVNRRFQGGVEVSHLWAKLLDRLVADV